jgi:peptidoglycan/xylan/chitin deacetylase (PgdA/CDA1 family)
MEREMKKFIFALLYAAGVTKFAAWWNRKRVVFLCYHGVTGRPDRSPKDPKGLHVNHRRFELQLDFLARRYHVISLSDYLAARAAGRRLPHYSVLLTFDDGFRNFLTAAVPLLSARRIPATVFLITDNVEERTNTGLSKTWSEEDDCRYLSWTEARVLKEEFQIDFGSHTCTHSPLLGLSPRETEQELFDSGRALTAKLSIDTPHLAYPKGEYSRMLAEQARKQGYGCAVTTDRGANELDHDLFTLGRTLIGDDDDEASFAVRVSGLRWWLVRVRDFFVRKPASQCTKIETDVSRSEVGLEVLD